MRRTFINLTILALTAIAVSAQTKPSFEVASIKPSAPIDQAQMIAALQKGGKMPIGANVSSGRAEYRYMDLKALLRYAYGVKPYQIVGPDWMSTARFDIVAKMPEGSKKEDAPKMLQSLLEERFGLRTHRTSVEHPVLALVAGKGGSKLKASAEKPVAIDENTPLKPGESEIDGPDGPMRAKVNLVDMANPSSVIDMGLKGKMVYRINTATKSIHIDLSMVTMPGFADMLTQLLTLLSGGQGGRQVVDMTGIEGNYDASLEISLADMSATARSADADAPISAPGSAGGPGNVVGVAADPGGGGVSLMEAVQSLGLKLETRKAMVDQFIVDHIEKTPTEN